MRGQALEQTETLAKQGFSKGVGRETETLAKQGFSKGVGREVDQRESMFAGFPQVLPPILSHMSVTFGEFLVDRSRERLS